MQERRPERPRPYNNREELRQLLDARTKARAGMSELDLDNARMNSAYDLILAKDELEWRNRHALKQLVGPKP